MITVALLALICAQTSTHAENCDPVKNTSSFTCATNQYSYMLKASPGKGIGVYALHDISAGVPISDRMKFKVRMCEMDQVPQALQGHCLLLGNNRGVASDRFDQMPIFWYLNHSNTPNITIRGGIALIDDEWLVMEMYALKDIKAGEELLVDYNELGEPDECKEDYYRPTTTQSKIGE